MIEDQIGTYRVCPCCKRWQSFVEKREKPRASSTNVVTYQVFCLECYQAELSLIEWYRINIGDEGCWEIVDYYEDEEYGDCMEELESILSRGDVK